MSPEFQKAIPYLQAALDRSPGSFTISDVWDMVSAGQARLWPGQKSAAVTIPEASLTCWLAGGDMTELLDMLDAAEARAKAMGLHGVSVIDARKGWERVLAPRGYERQVVLFKGV